MVSAQEVTQFVVYSSQQSLSIMHKLKDSTLYLISGENNIIYIFIHSVRCTINCVLEKLLVFSVFESFIVTPCRIYGKYDAKCYY